jgi:hypothetical protein
MSSPNKEGDVFNGLKIPLFRPGERPGVFSSARMNQLLRALNALLTMRIVKGPTNQVLIADAGTVLQIATGATSGAAGGSASADKFRIKSYSGTYITCRTWDGTTEGNSDVYVALPPEIRSSIASEVIDGDTYTYTYTLATQSRVSVRTSDSDSVTEYMTPRFIVDQEILAIKVNGNTTVSVGGNALEYQAITGREWAAVTLA